MKISVVIPAYNLEAHLGRTLDSVMAQTSAPDEILVVDDGSSDRTIEIASRYQVRILRQSNQGPAAARNLGIQEAHGDWIAFLDGDDLWTTDRIAELRKAIEADPEAVIVANDEFEGAPDTTWLKKPLHTRWHESESPFQALYRGCFLSTSAVAARRQELLKVGGMNPALRSAQDYDLWLRLMLFFPKLRFIPKPLSYYVIREGSVSGNVKRRLTCLLQIGDDYAGQVSTMAHLRRTAVSFYECFRMSLAQKRYLTAASLIALAPVSLIKRTLSGMHTSAAYSPFQVRWETHSPNTAWDEAYRQCQRANLLQAPAYGRAKEKDGWKVHRLSFHHPLTASSAPLAIAQVLEKSIKVAGIRIASLYRMNRGPLWTGQTSRTSADERMLYAALRREFRGLRRRVLFIAPELEDSIAHQALLQELGFRARQQSGTHSSYLDLSKSMEELRQALKSKWRNTLSFAERAGLTVQVDSEQASFAWLMKRYQEDMTAKSFQGIPIPFLETLFQDQSGTELLTLRALSPESSQDPVAGILIARHGDSATYLVGHTGEAGRKLKANSFLLWQAAMALKSRGTRYFDLGGLDEVHTPSVTEFKRGMSGTEYRLLSEHLSI